MTPGRIAELRAHIANFSKGNAAVRLARGDQGFRESAAAIEAALPEALDYIEFLYDMLDTFCAGLDRNDHETADALRRCVVEWKQR